MLIHVTLKVQNNMSPRGFFRMMIFPRNGPSAVILAWTCAARALSACEFGIQPRMTLAWHSLNPCEALTWTWEKTFRRYCMKIHLRGSIQIHSRAPHLFYKWHIKSRLMTSWKFPPEPHNPLKWLTAELCGLSKS